MEAGEGMRAEPLIVDAYAGPGGWSEGLRMLGMSDVGIEWDKAACDTRRAAGHRTVRADVTTVSLAHLRGLVRLLIGSPPCTAFSFAGLGAGREVLDELCQAMYRGDWHAMRDEHPMVVWAPLDMGRLIEECEPDLIALEQVPPCLVLWEAMAHWLRARGYSVSTGVLNAADYGVPQTRQRAFLVASRLGPVSLPEPTHARHPVDSLFGTTAKWVSMAEALGWGYEDVPAATVSAGGAATGGAEPFGNADYRRRLTAYVVDRRTNSRAAGGDSGPTVPVPVTEPSPTLTGKSGGQWIIRPGDAEAWALDRPSTTIVGSFSPDVVAAPGYRKAGDPPRQDTPGSIKITLRDALILQSFEPDYPVQGSKTKGFEQVGNAVPPLLAAHVLRPLAALLTQEMAA